MPTAVTGNITSSLVRLVYSRGIRFAGRPFSGGRVEEIWSKIRSAVRKPNGPRLLIRGSTSFSFSTAIAIERYAGQAVARKSISYFFCSLSSFRLYRSPTIYPGARKRFDGDRIPSRHVTGTARYSRRPTNRRRFFFPFSRQRQTAVTSLRPYYTVDVLAARSNTRICVEKIQKPRIDPLKRMRGLI